MTADDLVTKVIGSLVAFYFVIGAWLVKAIVGNDKEVARVKDHQKVQDAKTQTVEDRVDKLDKEKVTPEVIRQVFKTELGEHLKNTDRLDRARDAQRKSETKELIRETVDELAPRIFREMRGDSGQHKRTPKPRDEEDDG